jgi:hypothetical protein
MEPTGTWKNSQGQILTFKADSSVMLGQEGYEGGSAGRWFYSGDTLIVRDQSVMTQEGEVFNEYYMIPEDGELRLVFFTLHRGADIMTQSLEQLAPRMGKTVKQYNFVRTEPKKENGK